MSGIHRAARGSNTGQARQTHTPRHIAIFLEERPTDLAFLRDDLACCHACLQRYLQTRRHRPGCVSSGYHQIPLEPVRCLADSRQYPTLHPAGPARNGNGSPLAACIGGRREVSLSAAYLGLEIKLPIGGPTQREVAPSALHAQSSCTLLHTSCALQICHSGTHPRPVVARLIRASQVSPDFECSGNSFGPWLEAQPRGWPAHPVTSGRVWREPAPDCSRGAASRTGDCSRPKPKHDNITLVQAYSYCAFVRHTMTTAQEQQISERKVESRCSFVAAVRFHAVEPPPN